MYPEPDTPSKPKSEAIPASPLEDAATSRSRLPWQPHWQPLDTLSAICLLVTSLWHLVQLGRFELAPDEAYYWDWSRQLDWGYYDQGPLIAYVIRLTTTLFGTNEFGVRFGVWAATLGSLICAWWLARRLYSPLAGFIVTLLLAFAPLTTVGSLIATYDPLLVFFWALTLVFLERALFADKLSTEISTEISVEISTKLPTELSTKLANKLSTNYATQRIYWMLAGVSTGLGFLSKHTMALILPCLVLYLLCSPAHRFWLFRPEPYLAFLIALLLYGGVFYWNANHHWWTFGHLIFLAKKSRNSPLSRFGEFIGSQALLIGPGLFVACLMAVRKSLIKKWREAKEPRRGEEALFLIALGYPILAFFCLMTLRAKVQANWAPCAWISPAILVAGWLASSGNTARSLRSTMLLVVPSLFLTVALVSPSLRYLLGVRLKPKDDVTVQMAGWREMAKEIQRVRAEMERGGRKVFLAGNGYQYCALMAFYLPDHPQTHDMYLHYRLTMYAAHVERLKKHLGEDCLFLNDGRADDHDLRTIFEHVEWDEPPYPIWRTPYNKEPVRFIHMARCYGYRRYTGIDWAVGG